MKKILSIMLSLALTMTAMTTLVSADTITRSAKAVTDIDGWTVKTSGNPTSYIINRAAPSTGVRGTVDGTTKNNGRPSQFIDQYGEDYCIHMYKEEAGGTVTLQQTITGLEPEYVYAISFDAYHYRDAESTTSTSTVMSYDCRNRDTSANFTDNWNGGKTIEAGANSGWQNKANNVKPKADGTITLRFSLSGDHEGLYIDGLRVHARTTQAYTKGDTIPWPMLCKENKVVNPGLTANYGVAPGDVSAVTSTVEDGTATIYWQNPDDKDLNLVKIVDAEDETVYATVDANAATQATISNYNSDNSDVIVYVYDVDGNVSQGYSYSIVDEDISESTDLPWWVVSEYNTFAKVTRVFNTTYNSWMLKLSRSGDGVCTDKVKYYIPKDKLIEGHTYTISAFSKTDMGDNAENQYISFVAGGTTYTNTAIKNHKDGLSFKITCNDLYTKNFMQFGFGGGTYACDWYLDNFVVTDITDPENPVVLDLDNLDFESVEADYVMDATEITVPAWTIRNMSCTKAERIHNFERGSWMLKLTHNGSAIATDKVLYTVPREKLTEGHTYKVEMYSDIDADAGSDTKYYISFKAGDKACTNTWINNHYNGITMAVKGADLYANNVIMLGFGSKIEAEWYLDDLVVTDETTGEVLVLENFDFETVADKFVSFEGNDGGDVTVKILSKNETYDINLIWATYEVDENGGETLDAVSFDTKTITASDNVQTFTIEPTVKAGYVTKAFLWKADTMMPLADAIELDAVESVE